jgi:ABC-type multidrug transport system ATPase subunit
MVDEKGSGPFFAAKKGPDPFSPPPVLEIRNLTYAYGRSPALTDLSLTVRAGDLYGFLGPNGAGKTTTMRLVTRLLRPPRGRVFLFGADLASDDPMLLARVGTVLEGQALYPYLTARENLLLVGRLSGGVERDRPDRLLATMGLEAAARKKVRTFSQGMRMRLLLAAALLHRPALVVLDEPWNGLDPLGVREVLETIRTLREAEGTTFFLSSHQLHEVEALCDRVGLLREGRLIVEGETHRLLQNEEVVLEVRTGDPARAREALERQPWCRAVGDGADGALEVVVERGAPPLVARELVGAGIELHEMRERRPSLEEFFHRHFGSGAS